MNIKIYTLQNPKTLEIFYVELKNPTYNYIRNLLEIGILPSIELLETFECPEKADDSERYWISQFRAWGFKLTNFTTGGKKHTTFKIREDFITYNSRPVQQYDLDGNFIAEYPSVLRAAKHNNIEVTNIHNVLWGNSTHSYSKGFQWKYADDPRKIGKAPRKFLKSTSIFQFSIKGEFIREWDNAQDIKKNLNIHPQNISKCITGIRKYAGGYLWKYSCDVGECKTIKEFTPKPCWVPKIVIQHSLEGKILAEYPSAREAEKQTGVSYKNISLNINNKNKTAGGFIWKLKN
jgi:hypothetical protein